MTSEPAPLEFIRHPENTNDTLDPTSSPNPITPTTPTPDDPTSQILATPRPSAWPK